MHQSWVGKERQVECLSGGKVSRSNKEDQLCNSSPSDNHLSVSKLAMGARLH